MTTAETELARIRRTYTNRQTVPHQMLTEVLAWAKAHTAELEARHAGRVEVLNQMAEALRSTTESQRSTIELMRRQADERRSLHEARRDAGDGYSEVTIRRDDYLKAWRLSDLEEIAFRLRCGGGTDDTPVDMASNRAIAVVPAPNMVTLEHRPKLPERRDPLPDPVIRERFHLPPNGGAILTGAALLVGFMIALLGSMVGVW